MDQKRKQFEIHLPGLLKVLAESLYSTPKVALRELIQNSHDSCIRRFVEHADANYSARIDLFIDYLNRTLTIQDNGSGLTTDEVIHYLSTIGRSYTRELGETLAVLHPEEASSLIGQFGLGFLSAFLIADDIRVRTRSAKPNNAPVEWRSSGDIHYELSAAPEIQAGTSIRLTLKQNAYFLLNEELLAETVRKYADFLAIPIHINGSAVPVNNMKVPWEADDPESSLRDYAERSFQMRDVLWTLRLHDYIVDLGHDTFKVPLAGFLFVPRTSVASVQEYGDVQVYIRRMFICNNERKLLPAWAKFVRGVIDTPHLQPTASREDIQKNESFIAVQQAIESQLLDGLKQLAGESPPVWKQIISGHSDVIIGWATTMPQFFTAIADVVNFRTSRGLLSLPEYLSMTGNTIYYTAQPLETLQQRVLAEAAGLPVIDAAWFAVEPFLRLYSESQPDLQLIKLDEDMSRTFQSASEADFLSLLNFFRLQGITTEIVSFKPDAVPAIMIYSNDADFVRKTLEAIDTQLIPDPISELLNDYIGRLATDGTRGTLYLNATCEIIQILSQLPSSVERDATLTVIQQMARLFSGKLLNATELIQLFSTANQALKKMITD